MHILHIFSTVINSNSFMSRDFVSSLISEQYSNLGDFDECLEVNKEQLLFRSKYCLVSVNTPTLGQVDSANEVMQNFSTDYFTELAHNWLTVRNRFPFMHGVCVPSICTSAQLERLIQKCEGEFCDFLKLVITCNQI